MEKGNFHQSTPARVEAVKCSDMIQKFPQQFRTFFVYDGVLTVSVLKEHMHFNEASNTFEERVKDFFLRYIDEDVVISCGEGILTL